MNAWYRTDYITGSCKRANAPLIAGTLWEWCKSKRHLELLPIVAYGLAMCSFAVPAGENVLLPCAAGFFWLAIGLVVRVIVRRR